MKQATILISDKKITQFMQAMDVFEEYKVVIAPPLIATVVDDFGQEHVDKLLKGLEDCNAPYSLVAVVTDGFHWFNPSVKIISTGETWCTLMDYFGFSIP